MKLRRRAQWLLVLTLVPALGTLAALGSVLLGQLAGGAGTDAGTLAALGAQLKAAEIALWLGCAALLALALALGLVALQLWFVGPIEALQRDLAQDPSLDLGPLASDPFGRISAALAEYRRRLAKDRLAIASGLGAADALRGAAQDYREQLAQSDRLALVGRLALGVAHEVGGPLAIAAGQLERLEAPGASAAERQAAVAQAQAAIGRIHTILSDLSEPGLPRTRDADRPSDLLAVVLRVQGQAEAHPRCRSVHIDLQADADRHAVDASASHIEQVVLNLVLNAADAMKGAGHILLDLRRDGDRQVLGVQDDGPGVPEADRERIFEPFHTTKEHAGWGLGLSVSRRIVHGYGGTLTVSAAPSGGARFVLSLPVPSAQRSRVA